MFHQTNFKANGGLESLKEIILNLKNVNPYVLTQRKSELTESLEDAGISCKIINKNSQSLITKLWDVLNWNIETYKIIKSNNINVIHINDITALWHCFFGAMLSKVRIVFNLRGVIEKHRTYGKNWFLLKYCDKVIVLSKEMKSTILERIPYLKNQESKVEFIYSIVDFKKYHVLDSASKANLKDELGFSNQEFHIVWVAAFNQLKNQLAFIENALPRLKEQPIKLHFLGDFDIKENQYAATCLKALQEKGLEEKVVFHGFKSNINQYYQIADLTIVPSKREGLARCMIESLATGTSVISFDVSSAHEILTENEVGWVIPQGDYNAFANKIIENLKNIKDLECIGSKAAVLAQSYFNKEKIIMQYQRIYFNEA